MLLRSLYGKKNRRKRKQKKKETKRRKKKEKRKRKFMWLDPILGKKQALSRSQSIKLLVYRKLPRRMNTKMLSVVLGGVDWEAVIIGDIFSWQHLSIDRIFQ